MRNKLIELLKSSLPHFENPLTFCQDEHVAELADHLVANGVIVPPIKVDDTVYALGDIMYQYEQGYRIEFKKIYGYYATSFKLSMIDDIGKTVFLTREEAEQALKGGGNYDPV